MKDIKIWLYPLIKMRKDPKETLLKHVYKMSTKIDEATIKT